MTKEKDIFFIHSSENLVYLPGVDECENKPSCPCPPCTPNTNSSYSHRNENSPYHHPFETKVSFGPYYQAPKQSVRREVHCEGIRIGNICTNAKNLPGFSGLPNEDAISLETYNKAPSRIQSGRKEKHCEGIKVGNICMNAKNVAGLPEHLNENAISLETYYEAPSWSPSGRIKKHCEGIKIGNICTNAKNIPISVFPDEDAISLETYYNAPSRNQSGRKAKHCEGIKVGNICMNAKNVPGLPEHLNKNAISLETYYEPPSCSPSGRIKKHCEGIKIGNICTNAKNIPISVFPDENLNKIDANKTRRFNEFQYVMKVQKADLERLSKPKEKSSPTATIQESSKDEDKGNIRKLYKISDETEREDTDKNKKSIRISDSGTDKKLGKKKRKSKRKSKSPPDQTFVVDESEAQVRLSEIDTDYDSYLLPETKYDTLRKSDMFHYMIRNPDEFRKSEKRKSKRASMTKQTETATEDTLNVETIPGDIETKSNISYKYLKGLKSTSPLDKDFGYDNKISIDVASSVINFKTTVTRCTSIDPEMLQPSWNYRDKKRICPDCKFCLTQEKLPF